MFANKSVLFVIINPDYLRRHYFAISASKRCAAQAPQAYRMKFPLSHFY